MKINKDLNFLKSQCKKLKMCKRNRRIYFRNVREDMGQENPFTGWDLLSLAGQVSYRNTTVGCNYGYHYEPLPSLSQQEGTFE